jgi:hypothetical protein
VEANTPFVCQSISFPGNTTLATKFNKLTHFLTLRTLKSTVFWFVCLVVRGKPDDSQKRIIAPIFMLKSRSITKLTEANIGVSPKYTGLRPKSRSQWPRCLWLEMSSLARTLGSLVRIPLKVLMSVCVYSVFVLGSVLETG